MPAALLDSQLETLEKADDLVCVRVGPSDTLQRTVDMTLEALQRASVTGTPRHKPDGLA